MTATRHRSSAAADAHRSAGSEMKGAAPGGMWLAAWRQHRLQIAVVLIFIVAVIVALVAFRETAIAKFEAAGCKPTTSRCTGPDGGDIWWVDDLQRWSDWLHTAVIIGPIVLGVFAGGPIFTREFSRDTHIFALTQSVSRHRWWASKIVVVGVPLVAGLLALGFVTGWVDATFGYTAHHGLGTNQFMTRAVIPAAHGLLAFGIAIAAGIVTRSTVTTLIAGLVLGGTAIVGLAVIQPHLLPASRALTPIGIAAQESPTLARGGTVAGPTQDDPDAILVGSGYLDADGDALPAQVLTPCFQQADAAAKHAVGITDSPPTPSSGGAVAATALPDAENTPKYNQAFSHTLVRCEQGKGIVAKYTDYLPGRLLWPLRWVVAGTAAFVAALFLLLGAARLRAAAAKR